MKLRFSCLALLLVTVFIAAGCVPVPTCPVCDNTVSDTRGAVVPTDTPTPPVSPLPSPTTISPLAVPTQIKSVEANTEKAETTAENAAPLPVVVQSDGVAATMVDYVVGHGDTLAKIAERYNVTVQDILDANSKQRKPDLIFVGQHLNVPARLPVAAATPQG